MTAPMPTSGVEQIASDSGGDATAVRALLDQAKALGLTWTLRLATVSVLQPMQVTMDGDTVPVPARNMMGATLLVGARVYVIIVPPSGVFVIGVAANDFYSIGMVTSRSLTAQGINSSSVTTIVFDSYDTTIGTPLKFFNTPIGTTFTIPYTGVWSAWLWVNVTGSGARNFIEIVPSVGNQTRSSFVSGEDIANAQMVKHLTAGTTVICRAYQTSGISQGMISQLQIWKVPLL